jgi:hypothetical protein
MLNLSHAFNNLEYRRQVTFLFLSYLATNATDPPGLMIRDPRD